MKTDLKASDYFLAGYSIREKTLYIIISIVALAPIFMMNRDFWDGRIIAYAFRTGNFTGLKTWFFESRWFLQYYVYRAIHFLSSISGVDYKVLIRLLAILCLFGISGEAKYLMKYLFNLPEKNIYIARLFIIAYPAWHVLVSSVLISYMICIWLILLGYRLLLRSNYLGLIAIGISLHFKSNFPLLIALILSDYISHKYIRKDNVIKLSRTLLLSLLVCILFVVIGIVLPTYGLYSNYNQFDLRPVAMAYNTIYLVLFIISMVSIYLLFFAASSISLKHRIGTIFRKEDLAALIILVVIYSAVSIPYIAVGKVPRMGDFNDWTHRNVFLTVIPLSLFIALISFKINQLIKGHNLFDFLHRITIGLSLLVFVALLYVGYQAKVNQLAFESSLIDSISSEIGKPAEGSVHISTSIKPPSRIRWYEANSIFQRVFGEASWMVEIDSRPLDGSMEGEYDIY
ncbi:MAG: hypothetical protein GF417_10540, partial [Candidatus Latescibacteria bacterium]|nr:hypothetical protein [bacterium]MBD3424864.1 hypothetical protein [Candidatus Latescibacterota bacterium]